MGIESFYGIWLIKNFDKNSLTTRQLQRVSSVFIDCNGIFHKAAQETYYYTQDKWKKEEYQIKKEELYQKYKSLKPRDQKLFLLELQNRHITNIKNTLTEISKRLKPQDNLVIVPDGVSNAAKINQQKSRRFLKGTSSDDKVLFDSNAITPGTDFMVEVDRAINEWIVSQKRFFANGLKIIYSSHLSEGEGEHKIFDFIRNGEIKPSTGGSNVIYGMDADLIVLSLLSSLKNIHICRENLSDYLIIDKLREELIYKLKDSGQSDEQILRDFATMASFIGNDFVSPLPSFVNPKDTLDHFFEIYVKLKLPLSDARGYSRELKENKYERKSVLGIFTEMRELEEVKNSEFWDNKLNDMSKYIFPTLITYLPSNMKMYYDRKSKANRRSIQLVEGETLENFNKVKQFIYDYAGIVENPNDYKKRYEYLETYDINLINFSKILTEYYKKENKIFQDIVENPPEFPYPELMVDKFNREEFRINWYKKEFFPRNIRFIEKYYNQDRNIFTQEDVDKKCMSYIRIIQWVLTYYTNGYKDISHDIFYPYLYSPMTEDIITSLKYLSEQPEEIKNKWLDVSKKEEELNITPVHQLLSVMPHSSSILIPKEYREIYDTYLQCINPKSFEILQEGTDKSYHKTAIIPPIDLNLVNNFMIKSRNEIPKRYESVPDLIVMNKKFTFSNPKFQNFENKNIRKKYFIDPKINKTKF